MPSIRISFDNKAVQDNVNRIIGKKVAVIHYTETRNDTAGVYAKYISKYVPFKTGTLRRSATITDGEIRYSARSKKGYNYADIQYRPEAYGYDESTWERHTPDTYSHWNRHLSTAERQAFYQEVAKIVAEKMNKRG